MKKYLAVICCGLFLLIAGYITVKAGYYVGPNNSLYVSSKAGWLWLEGTISNDSAQHYKQMFTQNGNQGSWSAIVAPSVHEVTQKDSRAIWEPDTAFLRPCWKVNAGDSMTCGN
ncbi:MAG: hypothetical protein RSB71_01280 [Bacilli bacterium]